MPIRRSVMATSDSLFQHALTFLKVFSTNLTSGNDVESISFINTPLFASSVQIKPFTWIGDAPCIRMELYGCMVNNSKFF